MPPCALIADRFFRLTDDCVIDLATGDDVWMQVERERSPTRDWAERCAALYGRRHRYLTELVDYGPFGREGRFEAFATGGPLRRWPSGESGRAALRSCTAFLLQEGLSPGPRGRARMIDVRGLPRLLPDQTTGFPLHHGEHQSNECPKPRDRPGPPPSLTECSIAGVVVQPRSAVSQVIEFLETCWSGGPRGVHLRAPAGAGLSTTLQLVARGARLQGIVPITTALHARQHVLGEAELRRQLLNELEGRHIVLLHDRDGDATPERETARLVDWLLNLSLPHLHVAVVSVSDVARSSSIVLEPLTATQLVAMLGAIARTKEVRAKSLRAVRTSDGWPGRFARALGVRKEACRHVGAARERAPEFESRSESDRGDPNQSGSAAGADLDGWRRLVEARRLGGRGRHAAAIRAFRQSIGMCDRRGDSLHAGAAWHELGELLLLRGAAEAAREAFAHARQRLQQGGAPARALLATVGEASARMAIGQLKEAEAMLRTAELAALHANAPREGLAIRTALLTCLHSQARWDDAVRLIERDGAKRPAGSGAGCSEERGGAVSAAAEQPAEFAHPEGDARVLWHCAAAGVAMERSTLASAAHHVAAAIGASSDGPSLATCASRAAAVRLHGWIGDAAAVHLHAAAGLDAARACHAPMEALRIRLNLMGALVQAGVEEEARSLAMRLLRIRPSRIPALLRAELAIAVGRVLPHHAEARRRKEEAEAFAGSIGAAALLAPLLPAQSLPKPLCDIVDVVRTTHEYADEQEMLQRAAELLRDRLHAASVAIAPAQDAGGVVVAVGAVRGVGGQRAIEKGIAVGPVRTTAGIEMAVPIRCGSATVGAIECRWPAGGPDNPEHARALIVATAAVSGPFVKSVMDRRASLAVPDSCPELLGGSLAMAALRQAVARAAGAPFPVLIAGESGVGKELVARAIHRESPRRLRNFATLNCAALTEDLIESELFGHARGAFTGAVAERRGLFEEADGGTLFLDEVSELSLRAQAKLLRVLQEGEVRRVGESFSRHVEVRVVAATNRSLDVLVAERLFRQDLRYRLDVIRIEVPPLRHRLEDIGVLARVFWTRAALQAGCRASLSSATLAALARYDWPGNVRELQNVVSAMIVAAPARGIVGVSALPASVAQAATVLTASTLDEARQAFERRYVMAALARAGGRRNHASRELGLTRQGLAKLIKRLGISDRIQNTEDRIQKAGK